VRPGTVLRLATAGTRTDRLRTALTAVGAALTTFLLLAAATVQWLPATEEYTRLPGGGEEGTLRWRYTSSLLNETSVRHGLAVALLVLTIPVLVFAGQSARLGAPARDRRLAAIRLAGATPGQARLVTAVETSVAGLVGALAGTGGYLLVRSLGNRTVMGDPFHDFTPGGSGAQRPLLVLPTDALPPAWTFAATVLAVPVAAALLSLLALRRVTVSPLAVARRAATRRLHWSPLVVLAVGIALVPAQIAANRYGIGDPNLVLPLLAWSSMLLMAIGIALSSAPLGQLAARAAARGARRPALLLATRRILADPWHGGRSIGIVLVCAGLGATAVTGLAILRTQNDAAAEGGGYITGWSTESGTHLVGLVGLVGTLLMAGGGLLCALVEGTVARRRTLVTLIAAGTPRGLLARVVAWQALLPAVPAIVLALAVGAAVPRLAARDVRTIDGQVYPIPVPWHDLAAVGLGALLTILLAVALSLPALRASTDLSELRTE
jgi:FtsX-like permease family protein